MEKIIEEKTDIKSLPLAQLTEVLEAMGEKKFRAKQMFQWMHVRVAGSFEVMSVLS